MGFEPTDVINTYSFQDCCNKPALPTIHLAVPTGLEPVTNRLTVYCSTIELRYSLGEGKGFEPSHDFSSRCLANTPLYHLSTPPSVFILYHTLKHLSILFYEKKFGSSVGS